MKLMLRRLNRFERSAEPVYEGVSDEPGKPAPEPRRLVTGVEPMKQFQQEELGQSAANAEAMLLRLDEEPGVEMRDVVLCTPTKFRLE